MFGNLRLAPAGSSPADAELMRRKRRPRTALLTDEGFGVDDDLSKPVRRMDFGEWVPGIYGDPGLALGAPCKRQPPISYTFNIFNTFIHLIHLIHLQIHVVPIGFLIQFGMRFKFIQISI